MTSNQRGQSLVELGTGILIVIPIVLLCMDLYTLYMGVSLNDTICRDAARSASVGPPSAINPGEPLRRAQGIAVKANRVAGAVQLDPKSVSVTENIVDLPPANYGGPVNGQVTVTTSVKVFPPFILSIMSGPQGFLFTTNKTMPYTWSRQSTLQQTPASGAGQTF